MQVVVVLNKTPRIENTQLVDKNNIPRKSLEIIYVSHISRESGPSIK